VGDLDPPVFRRRADIARDYSGRAPHYLAVNYWLVKQEPQSYAWATFVREGRTAWTGVRNFQARNNLRTMKRGDLVLYYHSGADKQVMGYARVEREAYRDPTAEEGDWSCVDLVPMMVLKKPVGLAVIKADEMLRTMLLVRHTRLSVMPLARKQFDRVLQLGGHGITRR
jgi:predicted RNA-binding protein with PUA-like domain